MTSAERIISILLEDEFIIDPRAANILAKHGVLDWIQKYKGAGWKNLLFRSGLLGGHKYLDWILREYKDLHTDKNYLMSWAEWFERNKNKVQQSGKSLDIYSYHGDTIGQELQPLISWKKPEEKGKAKVQKEKNYTVLGREAGWTAYAPWSHLASVYLGHKYVPETPVHWCIAARSSEGSDAFEVYTQAGALVFFINPKTKAKYAIHVEHEEGGLPEYHLFDSKDHSLTAIPADLPKELLRIAIEFGARQLSRQQGRNISAKSLTLTKTDQAHADDYDPDAEDHPEDFQIPEEPPPDFSTMPDEELFWDEPL